MGLASPGDLEFFFDMVPSPLSQRWVLGVFVYSEVSDFPKKSPVGQGLISYRKIS